MKTLSKLELLNKNMVAFRKIFNRIHGQNINYAIHGSTALALHGVDVIPRDIDIITTENNLIKFENAFLTLLTKEKKLSKFCKSFNSLGKQYIIHGVDVDVWANSCYKVKSKDQTVIKFSNPIVIANNTVILKRYGMQIPVFTLLYEYDYYKGVAENACEEWLQEKGVRRVAAIERFLKI